MANPAPPGPNDSGVVMVNLHYKLMPHRIDKKVFIYLGLISLTFPDDLLVLALETGFMCYHKLDVHRAVAFGKNKHHSVLLERKLVNVVQYKPKVHY